MKKKHEMFYGYNDLIDASNYNKIKKLNSKPLIENPKIKKIIGNIKDFTSFGPYLSQCNHCYSKNINFYNSSDPEYSLKILNTIQKSIKNHKNDS